MSWYLGDVTLADFIKRAKHQAWSLRAQRSQKTWAVAGCSAGRAADGTLGCASAPRHSEKGQQHTLPGALARVRCWVEELQQLQLFTRASPFTSAV